MARLILVTLFGLSAAGCGTFGNTVWLHEDEGGNRVYGGVRLDAEELTRPERSPRAVSKAYVALDLPFSAVADTLTLPYVLWRSMHPEPAPQKIRPDEGTPTGASPREPDEKAKQGP